MYRLYSLLFLVVLALAGCAPTPPTVQPEAPDRLAQTAQGYVEQGDYVAAAQLYLSESKTAAENEQPGLRLKAAEFLARGQLWEQLAQVLASIDAARLNQDQQLHYQLFRTELALSEHQPERALELLQQIATPESLPDHGQRYYQLRAEAYSMTGNALEAARQLIWLDGLLIDPQVKLDNQYRIWEQLTTLSDELLQQLRTMPPPDPLAGWMELIVITRQNRGDQQQWAAQLDSWRSRYPDHAAEAALLPDLLNQVGQFRARATRVAVLLPLTGRAADSATAIRDGIIAAYYQDTPEQPELRFYDTAGNAQMLWPVYQQAIQEGAEFVIGPLLKDSIEQLALSGHLPVPVLALNQIGNAHSSDLPLYQFGLAPEDEARQVAERAFNDGHKKMITLVPDSAWGQRVFEAFDEHFSLLGGEVLATGLYAAEKADYKGPIQHTLNLDASKNRHRALERLMGQKLNYEPRRRQDVEAIFLLGFPTQARQIRPQLRFHHAGDLPVYSTSHVFSASSDKALDRDMDGLVFCDIPWVLDTQGRWARERDKLLSAWPSRGRRYQRLFALGFDAYQVIPWLDTLNIPGFAYFPGATGVLTIDPHKQLHRALEWARFQGGVPNKLVSTEGQDEQTDNGGSR